MKTDVEIKPNHTCGYCQSYLEHVEQKRLTLHQLGEIETRLSQGWRLRGDLLHLINDIKYYLAQQSK